MRTLIVMLIVATVGCTSSKQQPAASEKPQQWRPLFNGKDLSGWETWLGRPHPSVQGIDLPKDEKGQYVGVVGLNKDPKHVYSVVEVDGAPAIRISGEIFGALTSTEEFENYRLKFEFKWGDEKFEPRTKAMRDSGILYYCVGPHGGSGGGSRAWMQSHECQIQEHDCGDYWSVADAMADVQAVPTVVDGKNKTVIYTPGAEIWTIPNSELTQKRAIKSTDNEKPTGQWNTVEIVCVGGAARHLINGMENMVISNSRRMVGDQPEPLTKGKLQLQSEGAEIFYRNIMIRPELAK
jgi:hypothetical protein